MVEAAAVTAGEGSAAVTAGEELGAGTAVDDSAAVTAGDESVAVTAGDESALDVLGNEEAVEPLTLADLVASQPFVSCEYFSVYPMCSLLQFIKFLHKSLIVFHQ